MKRLLLLLFIGSSACAMEPKPVTNMPAFPVPAVAVASLTAMGAIKTAAIATPMVACAPTTFPVWALIIPNAPTVAVVAAASVTAYGAWKGGEYLYSRYTKPANAHQ